MARRNTNGERRFQRQFDAIGRTFPALRGPMSTLRRNSWFPVRFPLALTLIVGGFFAFMPVLGVWMPPLGFLLLAVDLPILRGPISVLMIRCRRRGRAFLRRWRDRRR